MLSTSIQKTGFKDYPFKVVIDMDRIFESEAKAKEYLKGFLKFEEIWKIEDTEER